MPESDTETGTDVDREGEVDDEAEVAGDSEADGGTGTGEDPTAVVEVEGTVVSAVDGSALVGAVVTAGRTSVVTDDEGRFVIRSVADQPVTVERPAWIPATVDVPALSESAGSTGSVGDTGGPFTVPLEPLTVRALRVSSEVAADPARFDELLDLADNTTVNALVFDTKDETDRVLYRSEVAFARTIGAVEPFYDPAELLARARERDLYAVTRIVTFEDRLWAETTPEAQLALAWVDPTDRTNWEYPLALAEEACEIGFDEVQFDYVRYPAGLSAERARDRGLVPETTAERAAVIGGFLDEARGRLAPMGCGVSAAIFGIVMSSEGDEGIGQTVEEVSASVDAVSPMLYPSHYGPGWIGFEDPNDHPGPVIAHALDGGAPRLAPNTLMRPWLQAFFYNGAQIKAQIAEVEQRGGGWILWNASGRYQPDWLPTEGTAVDGAVDDGDDTTPGEGDG